MNGKPLVTPAPVTGVGLKILLLNLALLLVICSVVYDCHRQCLFLPYDGAHRLDLIKSTYQWTRPTINASITPLQGLGGFSFPLDYWLSPSALIPHFFHTSEINKVSIYTFVTVELFLMVFYLGICLKNRPRVSLLGAWLSVVFIMPFITPLNSGGYLSFYSITAICPDLGEYMAIVCLIICLILKLNLSRFGAFLLLSFAISMLMLCLLIEFQVGCLLSFPLIASFLIYSLACQATEPKKLLKIIVCLAIIALPVVLPGIYVGGLFVDSTASVFPGDFAVDRPPWEFISVLFHGPAHIGWAGTIIFIAGFSGAIYAIAQKTGPLKAAAVFYVCYSLLILLSGLLLTFVFTQYRFPSAIYFEWFIWPWMFLYTAYLCVEIFDAAWRSVSAFIRQSKAVWVGKLRAWISPLYIRAQNIGPAHNFIAGCALGLLACPFAVYLVEHPTVEAGFGPNYVFPPMDSAFTRELSHQVGLAPNSPWKGCVATMSQWKAVQNHKGVSWPDQLVWDSSIWESTGSEYRAVCLWWRNIPTLFVYNQCMSPEYYYTLTRLFSSRDDAQNRSVIVLTHPNFNLLELFGVKVLISDTQLPPNVQSASVPSAPEGIFAYELKRPNLSGFTPVQVFRFGSARETLTRMLSPDFQPSTQAIVDQDVPAPLTASDAHEMDWRRNSVYVAARAPGLCLLVLPLTYSHCLKLIAKTPDGEIKPQLMRVDLTLTGILFSKSIKAFINPNYGPFTNVFGRFEDYRDLKSLLR